MPGDCLDLQEISMGFLRKSLVAIALLATLCTARAAGTLASNADFKLLAWLGFSQATDGSHPEGGTFNAYAWSMAWFKGKLHVGTANTNNDGTFEGLQDRAG